MTDWLLDWLTCLINWFAGVLLQHLNMSGLWLQYLHIGFVVEARLASYRLIELGVNKCHGNYDWLIAWLLYWLIHWLFDWLTARLPDWLIAWLIDVTDPGWRDDSLVTWKNKTETPCSGLGCFFPVCECMSSCSVASHNAYGWGIKLLGGCLWCRVRFRFQRYNRLWVLSLNLSIRLATTCARAFQIQAPSFKTQTTIVNHTWWCWELLCTEKEKHVCPISVQP